MTDAKKREALDCSMANHGFEIVEKDATHLNKEKVPRKEEKT